MPPLAVVGFGLATLNWAVFGGSLLLYFTNLKTIALTATVMAWLYGFRSHLSERQTQFQIFAMVVVFVGLAIPLGLSLIQTGHEANISRSANGYIKDQLGSRARVSQIDIDFYAEPILVSASVFTPTIRSGAKEQQQAVETQVSKLRENLALIAGVNPDEVVIDTVKRRAIVMAKPLPGASVETYYALEQRMVR